MRLTARRRAANLDELSVEGNRPCGLGRLRYVWSAADCGHFVCAQSNRTWTGRIPGPPGPSLKVRAAQPWGSRTDFLGTPAGTAGDSRCRGCGPVSHEAGSVSLRNSPRMEISLIMKQSIVLGMLGLALAGCAVAILDVEPAAGRHGTRAADRRNHQPWNGWSGRSAIDASRCQASPLGGCVARLRWRAASGGTRRAAGGGPRLGPGPGSSGRRWRTRLVHGCGAGCIAG